MTVGIFMEEMTAQRNILNRIVVLMEKLVEQNDRSQIHAMEQRGDRLLEDISRGSAQLLQNNIDMADRLLKNRKKKTHP